MAYGRVMMRRSARALRPPYILLAALTVACLVAALAQAPAAQASPSSPSSAVVTMGDSYISGEAGRWLGNSVDSTGSRDGTDRACVYTAGVCGSYDKSKVYIGGTAANGCHRSDVSELLGARLQVDRRFNIACSGAVTKNLFRAADGGVGQDGEPAQGDQLGPIAQAYRVKMIVVSIGGNDLGFSSIITACLKDYEAKLGPCQPSQQAAINAALPAAIAGIEKAIDEIRAVMATAGYTRSGYRLVLQTYPSVVPRAADARYPELGPQRTTFGCPFYDQDLTWAHDQAGPQIGGAVKTAAASRGVEVLDLGPAFVGHEFCANTSQEATPTSFPSPASAEWGRFLSGSAIQQGDVQEVFHPDAYGQQALGACLTQLYVTTAPGAFRCTDTPGAGPQAMTLARTATFVDRPSITASGVPRGCVRAAPNNARRVRVILRIAVAAGQSPLTVEVRLDGKAIETVHRATLRLVIAVNKLKPGRHKLTLTVSDGTGATAQRTVTITRCTPARHPPRVHRHPHARRTHHSHPPVDEPEPPR